MKFLTSDTHFFHKLMCSIRSFSSVEEMNEHLIENWNRMVRPQDEIFHLGDFAFTGINEIVWLCNKRLNGRKHLIRGNHDRFLDKTKNRELLLSEGCFETIQDYKEIKHDNNLIVLFHYGQRVWRNHHHNSIACHGHSHGSLPPLGRSVDVGVDAKFITDEYRPIHIDELIHFMKDRAPSIIDHHGRKENVEASD